jgi:hypothetical protein
MISQMNAMQNRLIAMERAQSSRPQHRPNDETNKVRSHKNYPKYLEYNKVIHIGQI